MSNLIDYYNWIDYDVGGTTNASTNWYISTTDNSSLTTDWIVYSEPVIPIEKMDFRYVYAPYIDFPEIIRPSEFKEIEEMFDALIRELFEI